MYVEHLVLNPDDLAEMKCDMASHDDIAMMRRGRLIERSGGFGTPIGENRFMVGAGQADPADVPAFAVHVVKTTEHQTILDCAQLHQPILVHGGEGITFGALGRRAVRPRGTYFRQTLPGLVTQCVKPIVGAGDHLLFLVKLGGVCRHAVPFLHFRCCNSGIPV